MSELANYKERIVSNPEIMLGKPIIKGTRITVELIIEKLAYGIKHEDIIKSYPHITVEDILACLAYAHGVIAHEEMIETKK